MLLTSLASFAFEEIQGWPIVSMVAMCIGLLSVSVGITCATTQQGGYSSALGLCGGDLLLLWLKWFASASVTSSFAVTATASRSGGSVPPASLWLSLASAFCAMLSWWWWQSSDPTKAKSMTDSTTALAKIIGAILATAVLFCLVAALFSSMDASSTSPTAVPQPAVPDPAPAPTPPVLSSSDGAAGDGQQSDAAPSAAAPPPASEKIPATRDSRNVTGATQLGVRGGADGVVTAGVVGCAVALIGVAALALKKGGARRLLGTKQGEASYGGNNSGEELSRELSAEVSTANPVEGATTTV